MRIIYFLIARNVEPGSCPVLATVTGSTGSTPRKPGSSALFLGGRLVAGSIGGGIVEGRTMDYVRKCSEGCESVLLQFSLESETSEPAEAVCGGTITILIDSNPLAHITAFEEMEESIRAGQPGVLITKVIPWNETQVMIKRCWTTGTGNIPISCSSDEDLNNEVRTLLETGNRAGYREINVPVSGEKHSAKIFLEPVFPFPGW